MPYVIKTYDHDDESIDYRIHFEVTSPGCPAQTFGPPENCYPAEGPEWEITGIDGECWNMNSVTVWVPIEQTHSKLEAESVYAWAESLDLGDECVESAEAEREAWLEAQAECRRERNDD